MSGAAREGRFSNVAGAVLLGGASSRMGRDKAHIEYAGAPLATRTADLLSRVCDDVMLVGGAPPRGTPGRSVPDPGPDDAPRCALRGLVGALEAARAARVLVVATDMPHLSLDLLLALVAWPEHDAVVPQDAGGRLHPLCAIYRREPTLGVARRMLERGELAMRGLLDAIDAGLLRGADLEAVDPEGHALDNVNTPEELAAALA